MMRKKVKIVATLGPASDNKIMIKKLAQAGVNVFRLNLSHRNEEESVQSINNIRAVEKELGVPLAVLGDLAGPKIRIGMVEPPLELHSGQTIKIIEKKVNGTLQSGITLNLPNVLKRLEKGMEVYLDDGLLKFQIIEKFKGGVKARVIVGGLLKSRKGFSAQGLSMGRFQLSQKDKTDIHSMLKLGADALAVSFVQTAADIRAVKALLPKESAPLVFAKIETADAVKHAEEIVRESDGIMIARGDLGLSVPMAEVPFIQKQLIQLGLEHARPVITATQMLESMIHNPLPTRAEVTDVTKAILDGTDAVMLSGETAAGKHPEEVVKMMSRIIAVSELKVAGRKFTHEVSVSAAMGSVVGDIANQMKARLIIVFSQSGYTARRIARHRYGQPVIACTESTDTMRKLTFSWGVESVLIPRVKNFDDFIPVASSIARSNVVCKLRRDEPFVVTAGVPFGKAGTTNLIFVGRA